jgi:hypothetical protein
MVQAFGTGYMLVQGGGTKYEFVRKHTWEIQIDTFDTVLLAKNVAVGSIDLTQGEAYHFNERTKFAKLPNPAELKVTLLDAIDPNVVTELWTWFKQIYNPNTGQMGYTSGYKRTGQLFQYDVTGNLIRTWSAGGLWLMHAPTPQDTLDYSDQDLVNIELNLSCDRLTLDALVAGPGNF